MARKTRAPHGGGKQAGGQKQRAPRAVDDDLLEYEDAAAGESDQDAGTELLPSRKGLLRSAMVLLLVLTHICAFMVGYYLMPPRVPQFPRQTFSEVREPAKATRRLGRQEESFGLEAQARAMLSFMVEQPGSKLYELHFTTNLKRCRMQANLQQQVLSRKKILPDGSGKVERWEGDVLERLQQAAAGKGLELSDTETKGGEVRSIREAPQQAVP